MLVLPEGVSLKMLLRARTMLHVATRVGLLMWAGQRASSIRFALSHMTGLSKVAVTSLASGTGTSKL